MDPLWLPYTFAMRKEGSDLVGLGGTVLLEQLEGGAPRGLAASPLPVVRCAAPSRRSVDPLGEGEARGGCGQWKRSGVSDLLGRLRPPYCGGSAAAAGTS